MDTEKTEREIQEERRNELEDLFDKANAAEDAAETPPVEADTQDTEPKGPDRDPETGKFKAKDDNASEEEIEPKSEPSAEDEPKPPAESLDAPASWSDAEKAVWGSLSVEAQKTFLSQDTERQKADTERAEKLKTYEWVDQIVQPLQQHLQLSGMQPSQYFLQLAAADKMLREQPTEAIKWLAGQFQVDLQNINAAPQEYEDVDESLRPLLKKIDNLEGQLKTAQTNQNTQYQANIQAEIDAFAKDHEHFDKVRATMGAMMQADPNLDMQAAYDKALWSDPDLRTGLLSQEKADQEEKRKAEAAVKAKQAEKVAETNLSNSGSSGGVPTKKYENRIDELSDIYDAVTGQA